MRLPEVLRADLDRYVRALEARFGLDLVSVVLFGSWARGDARPASDLDLLVVIRGLTGGRFERYGPVRELAREVSEELADRLSLIVSTPKGAEHMKPYFLGMLSGHLIMHDAGGLRGGARAAAGPVAGAGSPALRGRGRLRVLGPRAGLEAGRRGDPVTSDEMARDYLRRARTRRGSLDSRFAPASYPGVVRESQDIAELVLKGALRFVGVDPPKRHDVHKVLARFIGRFPREWEEAVAELKASLDHLAGERGPAFLRR